MTAELLCEAAALMRERAAVGSPSFWSAAFVTNAFMAHPHVDAYADGVPETVARGAQHIASWHPAVALAVADWLDTAGADLWAHGPLCCDDGCMDCDDALWMPHVRRALTVARDYLAATP